MFEGRHFRRTQWGYHPVFQGQDIITSWVWHAVSLTGTVFSYLNFFVNRLILPFSSVTSVIGFMLFVVILLQLVSGFYLAWYYIPEPGLVIELREEMFNETRYGFEIYQLHVRGVDVIFILSYLHIFKKIFLKNYVTAESDGWILGGYAFFWFHYVVALGICLGGSHLSDLTFTIAANIYWSLFDNTYKTYYIIFTNKHLNVDQLTRLMFFHYFAPWYYLYLVKMHVLFCHESWDSDSGENVYEDKSASYISWFYDAFLKEIQDAWYYMVILFSIFFMHHIKPYTVNYYFFEHWNISELDDINFYGVAPHWYFRPMMGLLVVSPTHYEGLMWMALFFLLLAFMPIIHNWYHPMAQDYALVPMQNSQIQTFLFGIFILSILCVTSMLPCGRYYYEPEGGYVGNPWVKFSFQYIFFYLSFLAYCGDYFEYIIFKKALHLKIYLKRKIYRRHYRVYKSRFKRTGGYTPRIFKFFAENITNMMIHILLTPKR